MKKNWICGWGQKCPYHVRGEIMRTKEEKNAYDREYYKKHHERLLKAHAEYRETHREERRAADREYKKRTNSTANRKLRTRWYHMISRCEKPSHKDYANYGGRGISVCEEWHDFSIFMQWALTNGFDETLPSYDCTLDRINVNGNYEPNNCRWVDMKTQQNNKQRNVA
jgi:hypothetical protein